MVAADDATMTDRLLPSSSPSLLARLHREWNVLALRPALVHRASGWGLGIPVRTLDDIVEATGFWSRREARLAAIAAEPGDRERGAGASGNAVMARLLVVARTDDLAARVVLQRLLPGLIAGARRWARRAEGGPEALDDLLSVAWTVIRTFPVERRPVHLVANLLRDAEYHAFVRAHRRALVHELIPSDALDRPAAPEQLEPMVALAEVVAAARTLSERDRRLVRLLANGTPIGEVASAMHVSVRTVGNHRDALVHRLRQAAAEMAVA